MSVRKKAESRLTIFRDCAICGQRIVTTANTPWMRQMPWNGKKQATVYFCSASCKKKSYKHLFDGKSDERRRERESKRDVTEKNRKYYLKNSEEIRRKQMEKYYENREEELLTQKYNRKKRKILMDECF